MPVATKIVVADNNRGVDVGDHCGDVRGDLTEVGRGETLRIQPLDGFGPIFTPDHAGVEVTPRFATDPARADIAEVPLVGDAEDAHGAGELALTELRELERGGSRFGLRELRGEARQRCSRRRKQVLELGGNDLAALTPGAGQHGDAGTTVDQRRQGSACSDRLIVRVGVNEQHSFLCCHRFPLLNRAWTG